MKTCRNCGDSQPITEFYRHRQMLDGHLNVCKPCVRKRAKEYRRLKGHPNHNGEEISVDLRKGTDNRRWRARYPTGRNAQNQVRYALKSGKLKADPCLFCGASRVQAHHRDYLRPLDVIWLCARCHNRLHKFFPGTEGANKEGVT